MGIYVLQIVDAAPTSARRRPAPAKKARGKLRPHERLRQALCIVADELAPVAQAEA